MMKSVGLPAGFRDVLFEEARVRRSIEGRMARVFEGAGYREVLPSGVESLEVYRKGHQSVLERAFRFLDREDNLLVLRADFTPAIARIAATRLASAEPPLRLWYSGSVFRKADATHRGYAEHGQVGAELLGAGTPTDDAEVVRVALECLEAVGIDDVRIHVNHAGVFRGIVNAIGLEGHDLRRITSEIDRKDARGIEAQLEMMGVGKDFQTQVHALSRSVGGPEVLTEARRTIVNPGSREAIDHLDEFASMLGKWKGRLVFDLAEIDEMEYYTGIMLAFLSPRLNREIGKGGRYDGLVGEFGRDLPAVGFSFSVESLIELQ